MRAWRTVHHKPLAPRLLLGTFQHFTSSATRPLPLPWKETRTETKATPARSTRKPVVRQPVPETKDEDEFPASLNVFHLGTGTSAYIGTFKVASIVACTAVLAQAASAFSLQEDISLFDSAILTLLTTPMLALHTLTSPIVHSINILLPRTARTRSGLSTFSRSPPTSTPISLTTMRFFPLPRRRVLPLSELRVLPKRALRFVNLEHTPEPLRWRLEAARERGESVGGVTWWIKAWWGGRRRYYVKRGGKGEGKGSRAPGVWDALWTVIGAQSGTVDARSASETEILSTVAKARRADRVRTGTESGSERMVVGRTRSGQRTKAR